VDERDVLPPDLVRNWRMASRNGRLSMSPTVPADLDHADVGLRGGELRMRSLISFGDVGDDLDRLAEELAARSLAITVW
jgi:hypothetical protein